ncbi:MAG: nitroreductase family protein [Flavobacteriales bacterium]
MIEQVIQQRRSVYPPQYNHTPIQKQEIEELLEAANFAPTHKKTQPWRFKVMHSKESREAFGEALSNAYKTFAPKFSNIMYKKISQKPVMAGAVIAICMQRDEQIAEWEEMAAVAMAVQNMWLLASEKKIGAYWGTPPFAPLLKNFLNLKEGEQCLGFFFLGNTNLYPEDWDRKPVTELTEWI